jgi:hypothetical protein
MTTRLPLLPFAALFLLALLGNQASATQQKVKLSNTGICHDSSSGSYNRTKNFTPYQSLEDCLDAGGRLPKGQTGEGKSSSSNLNEYRREHFGSGWADTDGDCQNSRHEALIAQSTGQVTFKDQEKCMIQTGRWISMYSGIVIHDATAIDIDHVVPLKWAWDHGANDWTKERRVEFANDPANLLAVEASLNRQKGAKGPDKWQPPANQCQYLSRFRRIAIKYDLPTNSVPDCLD